VAIVLSVQANRLKEQRDIANQQRDKATQESQRAETVSNFMLDVFTAADPFQSQDKQVTAKELLDKAANKIETSLNDQPEVKTQLLEAIGEAYLNQGQAVSAIKYLDQARQSFPKQLSKKQNIELLRILNRLGRAYLDEGDLANASEALSDARLKNEIAKDGFTIEFLQTLTLSGTVEELEGHSSSAAHYNEEALRIARAMFGNDHPHIAGALMSFAQALIWQSKYASSEPIITEAINIYRNQLPDKHPDKLSAELSLAEVFYYLGKYDEASSLAKRVYSDQLTIFGDGNPQLINTHSVLSRIYIATGSLKLAEEEARKGLRVAVRSLGESNLTTAVMHSTLANVLLHSNKPREAEQEATHSLRTLKTQSSPDHQYVGSAEYLLGASLIAQHRFEEAESILRENIARWKRTEAPDWRAARSESLLGAMLSQVNRNKEAAELLSHANQVLSAKDSGADKETISIARKRFELLQVCIAERRESNCKPGVN
jgi:tetratricopeptide (TPR) repeat protein